MSHFLVLFLSVIVQAKAPLFRYELAAHHAPVILQSTAKKPKADAITKFDFDGDWVANNNWKSLENYPTLAYVYYEVIETRTHYFITYAFYHPRDYASLCIWWVCHENDMEGTIITVVKDGTSFGKAIYLQTQAHNEIISAQQFHSLDGQMTVWSEGGGHGVHPWDGSSNPRTLVYRYGGFAEDPRGAREGCFKYELLPIWDLWERRADIGKGRLFISTYEYKGLRHGLSTVPLAFAGEKYGAGRANPPWAWTDNSDQLGRGEWFFDPALYVFQREAPSGDFDLDYVYHPYLGVGDDSSQLRGLAEDK